MSSIRVRLLALAVAKRRGWSGVEKALSLPHLLKQRKAKMEANIAPDTAAPKMKDFELILERSILTQALTRRSKESDKLGSGIKIA